MSELRETPDLSERWCPTCRPDRDPTQEILRLDYCETHRPSTHGADDARVDGTLPSGFTEAEGDTGRAMASVLRRPR